MSSKSHLTPNTKSLFYRDLASPISSSTHRSSRFATPSQAAAVSALWRENFGATSDNPPPPPIFTLEDRIDFFPESALNEIPTSPESYPDPKTPSPVQNYHSAPSPTVDRSTGSGGWWGPSGSDEKGKGSPVDVVVKMGALITVPPPREVARPEMRTSQVVPARDGMMDEEEWVMVYGFSPGDTNLVLREFEKCGVILKHIPGPRDANWMHILYQNRYDAQKALGKNGMQLNSVLVVGVKPVDRTQREYLNDSSSNQGGFMVSLPAQPTQVKPTAQATMAASARPQFLRNGGSTTHDARRSTGAIASPAKSVVSKVMDLMFGF